MEFVEGRRARLEKKMEKQMERDVRTWIQCMA